MSTALFKACSQGNFPVAEELRSKFLALEDLRDAWNPAKVLHVATEMAGVARTGPLIPYLSALSEDQVAKISPAACALRDVPMAVSK